MFIFLPQHSKHRMWHKKVCTSKWDNLKGFTILKAVIWKNFKIGCENLATLKIAPCCTVFENKTYFSRNSIPPLCNLIRLKWLCPILGTKSFHNVLDPHLLTIVLSTLRWLPKTFPLKISLSSIQYQKRDSQIWLSWLHAVPVTDLQNRFRAKDYVSVYSTEEKR